jgi:glutamine amidotransferase-like uncharacterized protein
VKAWQRHTNAVSTTRRHATALTLIAALGALAACRPSSDGAAPPVLLFAGTGTSPGDVKAVEALLRRGGLEYATATSAELNAMDAAALRRHRLLIVPGGNFVEMGAALTPAAAANVRGAVRDGASYLGICAGAFLAGRFTGYNSFDLTSGVKFGFYAISSQGVRKAVVPIARPGEPTLEHYWEDGPVLAGWGTPIATYPDGTPAIAEGAVGRGWVVLSGVHPEAPESWRSGMTFRTPAAEDNAFAATLIRAALGRTPLARSSPPR